MSTYDSLGYDIHYMIIDLLEYNDLISVSLTNKYYHRVSQDVARHILLRSKRNLLPNWNYINLIPIEITYNNVYKFCESNQIEKLQYLFLNNAPVGQYDMDEFLVDSIRWKHLVIMKLLIECGANINGFLHSPMDIACHHMNYEAIKYLFEKGIPYDYKDNKVLKLFVDKNNLEMTKYMLTEGSLPKLNNSTLIKCVKYKRHQMLQLLIDHNIDINFKDGIILVHTVRWGHLDIIKIIVPKVNINTYKEKCIRFAILYQHHDILSYLLDLYDDQTMVILAQELKFTYLL